MVDIVPPPPNVVKLSLCIPVHPETFIWNTFDIMNIDENKGK